MTGTRMWVVDWEYSGMNDPIWDLGDMSVEAGLDEAGDREMMAAYCDGPRAPRALRPHGHLQGHVRSALDPLGADPACQQESRRRFLGLCDARFERCKALMATPDFARHLDAIATQRGLISCALLYPPRPRNGGEGRGEGVLPQGKRQQGGMNSVRQPAC